MNHPDFKRRIEQQGAYAVYLNPAGLGQLVQDELPYWGKVIATAGIKVD